MLVIDFLKTIETTKLVENLVSTPGYFEMIDWDNRKTKEEKEAMKQKAKMILADEVNKIKLSTPSPEQGILVVIERCYDNTGKYYDASLLDYDNFNLENFKKTPEKNPLYGLIFSSRNKILGLELSEYCISKYGKDIVSGSILKELTTFSIFEEDRETKIKSITESLIEQEKHFDESKCISSEELFDSLRDKYGLEKEEVSEEEKELERQHSIDLANLYIKEYSDIIENTIKLKNNNA